MLSVLALITQGCAVSSTNQVTKPGEVKGGFMGLSKTAEVTVTQPKTLKNQSDKVIIGSFKVGFITEGKVKAVAKGGMFSGSIHQGKATARVNLVGMTDELMKKIANDAYQQMVQELQTAGYTVLAADELTGQPEYAALQAAGETGPQKEIPVNLLGGGKVDYVAPDGMNVIYFVGEKKVAFLSSMDTYNLAADLSEATGANVLSVNYIVNFANAETHGGFKMTAGVKVGQGLSLVSGSSIGFYKGKKAFAGALALGQPVYSEKEFATIEKVTSKVEKAVGTAVNMASALLGGGTSQSEEYNFNVVPEQFTAGAVEITTKTNHKLVAKLAEYRMATVAAQL